MVAATEGIFGTPGKVLLAIMVLFACLTTSIGLTSSAGRYFEDTTDGRLSYEKIVTAISIFSAVVSTFGVNKIIQISIPVLQTIYPVMIILVVLTIFTKQIKNDNTFKGAAYFTFVASILSVANSLTGAFEFINVLPLTSLGLGWIVPGLVGALVVTSSAGRYFEDTTDGRLSYEKIVTAISIFSAVVSTFGVNKIIQISIPILQTIYPVMIILVVLTIFTKQIKNDNTFKGAAYFTFVASILSVANSLTGAFEFINVLPLTSLGLGWIVPGLVGALVGSFIKTKGSMQTL